MNTYLDRLWLLASKYAIVRDCEPQLVFSSIGLQLVHPDHFVVFFPTPTNATVFARTGGDGVHYSILQINGAITDNSPIVMTVPFWGSRPNVIVGADLHDFLCLGCNVGYFGLESLEADWTARAADGTSLRQRALDGVITRQLAEDMGYGPNEFELLDILTREFQLTPYVSVEQHLSELEARYLHLVEPSLRLGPAG